MSVTMPDHETARSLADKNNQKSGTHAGRTRRDGTRTYEIDYDRRTLGGSHGATERRSSD